VFTDRELDLMGVLWDHGPSTAAEVRGRLPVRLAYTTVLSLLRVLEAKGRVAHTVEGKAHRFRATVSRDDTARATIEHLTRTLFHGSPALLLAHLIQDGGADPETIIRMRKVLKKRLKSIDD
jgi:predicted transcriptional regulator